MSSYYFSPGPVPMSATIQITESHRSEKFKQTFLGLQKRLSMAIGMEVAFIQGSASAAIESALMAVKAHTKTTCVLMNGTFSKRVVEYLQLPVNMAVEKVETAMNLVRAGGIANMYAVQYETANSCYTDLGPLGDCCRETGTTFIVDCVSGFPYFSIPKKADIAILSSSKLLRGLPAMGIVAFRAEVETQFLRDRSYLSLTEAIEYGRRGQTPHTSLMPQIESLDFSFLNQLWKPGVDAIDNNMAVLIDGLEHMVVGRKHSPVTTFKVTQPLSLVTWLAEKGFFVYFNPNYMTDRFQVSLYNYRQQDVYEEMNELIHAARDRKMVK